MTRQPTNSTTCRTHCIIQILYILCDVTSYDFEIWKNWYICLLSRRGEWRYRRRWRAIEVLHLLQLHYISIYRSWWMYVVVDVDECINKNEMICYDRSVLVDCDSFFASITRLNIDFRKSDLCFFFVFQLNRKNLLLLEFTFVCQLEHPIFVDLLIILTKSKSMIIIIHLNWRTTANTLNTEIEQTNLNVYIAQLIIIIRRWIVIVCLSCHQNTYKKWIDKDLMNVK